MAQDTLIIVTAHNEADRIDATLRALAGAFPDAPVWVADDGSSDETGRIAERAGVRVVRSERAIGKGGAATLAARDALARSERDAVVVLCDGDLGDSADLLVALAAAVHERRADLAVAAFSRRVGGGLGLVVGFARRAIRRRCGLKLEAPISGQRALRASALKDVLPFADGFGMEIGMTIDAARAGHRVVEIELDLRHRATGRTPAGFAHRGRQLRDCARADRARR
jgi:glycosyltransferase involved in cell wall biosynthesis